MYSKSRLPTVGERLHKVMAQKGIASRRKSEDLIRAGKVTVDGKPATIGMCVSGYERIKIEGVPLRGLSDASASVCRVIVYHKPEGEVCTSYDAEQRKTVFSVLPKLTGERWISVGRLDINTSGLLIFTNDGALAHRLMHPSFAVEREYIVRVFGQATDDKIEQLTRGVALPDGQAAFTDVVRMQGVRSEINSWFYVCLTEGRNREVRRLWESQGLRVNRLKRVRFGNIVLPKSLKKGQWMDLGKQDIVNLRVLVSLQEGRVYAPSVEDLNRRKRQSRKRSSTVVRK